MATVKMRFTPAEKEALAQQKNDHYVQLLEHLTTEDVLPGVVPLLQQAQARHIPCTVASASKNAPPDFGKIRRARVLRHN